VPIPHPAAEQKIWVGGEVLLRAQGVFFEASSFADLCGFFLSVAAAAYTARDEGTVGMRRSWLWLAIPILAFAVFVAFSRSSWGNIAVTLLVFATLSKRARLWRAIGLFLALAIPVGILWFYTPELWGYLINARLGNLTMLFADPNLASSGRYDTWSRVISIMQDNPQYLLFGVGHKTLPFTRLFHEEIITDNGYLNLLLETGVVGLGGFIAFSVAVLRTFLKYARRTDRGPAFWGALVFFFWCGQLVQMLAVDAYTFWRNMVVYLAVMAFTVNLADRDVPTPSANKVGARQRGGRTP
jgi:O-antigen ligase